jgi:hypothetical protein
MSDFEYFLGEHAQAELTLCRVSIDIKISSVDQEFTNADLSLHAGQLRLIHGSGCV